MHFDRRTGLALLAVLLASFAGGIVGGALIAPTVARSSETVPKVLTVQGIDLVDASGKLVARLGKNELQVQGLYFYDESGHDRLWIDMGPHSDSPEISMLDQDGWPTVGVHVEKGESGLRGFFVVDKAVGGIRLETSEKDRFGLRVSVHGVNRASLLADTKGPASLGFYDERGEPIKNYP